MSGYRIHNMSTLKLWAVDIRIHNMSTLKP